MLKHDKQFKKGQIPWNKGKKGLQVSWNKGTKGIMKAWNKNKKTGLVPKSAFKKGHKAPQTAFKKGMNTWNKGRKYPQISGEKNVNWKGGITPENHKVRTSLEMKLFRKACMERDNFTDQKTGQIGGQLVVHHINNFADFPELRTSISNGITFSKETHKEFHKKYGNKNNTQEQLKEFLCQK